MLALHFIFITHHLQQQQWLLPHVLCRPQVSVSCARHLIEISAERQIQVWFILPRTQSGTPCLTSVNSLCYLICADRIIPVAGCVHPIIPSHLPNYAVSYNQHKVVFSRSFSFKEFWLQNPSCDSLIGRLGSPGQRHSVHGLSSKDFVTLRTFLPWTLSPQCSSPTSTSISSLLVDMFVVFLFVFSSCGASSCRLQLIRLLWTTVRL